jgi:hypothetical protein
MGDEAAQGPVKVTRRAAPSTSLTRKRTEDSNQSDCGDIGKFLEVGKIFLGAVFTTRPETEGGCERVD